MLRRHSCVGVLVAALLVSAAASAQVPLPTARRPTPEELEASIRRMNVLHDAAELYRAGSTRPALDSLDTVTPDSQRAIARSIKRRVAPPPDDRPDIAEAYIEATIGKLKVKELPWDIPLARALGVLEMEAALRDYTERDVRPFVDPAIRTETAELLFEVISEKTGEASPVPRWEQAIGLTAFRDGQFAWAELTLNRACRQYPDNAALLLACGSLHDVLAMEPGDLMMRRFTVVRSPLQGIGLNRAPIQSTTPRDVTLDTLPSATKDVNIPATARRNHLESACRDLESVLHTYPGNVEARLRLAHARILLHDDSRAAPLLEEIVAGTLEGDARDNYLARLFLAGIRERTAHVDAATALLEEALKIVPSGQSAFVALAEVARGRGDTTAAVSIVERMLQAPSAPDDPWWEYRFGQHWVVDSLLAALRKDATQ